MDRNLALELIRAAEAAALSSARWMGKGDGEAARQAAEGAMHTALDSIYFHGTIVSGEKDKNRASKLHRGATVGCGQAPELDVAVDPLECTDSVAYGRANALSVVAMAPKGSLMTMPDIYMEKIAVGKSAAEVIDLNLSTEENLRRVAEAKGYRLSDLTVVMLDRERHRELIDEVRNTGVRIHLIRDGDVAAAIAVALPGTGLDVLMGTGGAAEGVLAAAALRCIGGEIQARLIPGNPEEVELASSAGFSDPGRLYTSADLARGDSISFAATGVTDGDLLNGVRYRPDGATTHSLVVRQATQTRRFVTTEHYFEIEPQY